MIKRRSVLVVYSDPQRLQRLGAALSADYDTWLASTTQAALQVLSSRQVDVVVADSQISSESFLEEVENRAPDAARVLLSSDNVLEKLISAMRKGHDFVAFDEGERTENLVGRIQLLASPRAATRHRPFSEVSVRFGAGNNSEGRPSLPLLDISNRGLAVHLEQGNSLEGFLPGTVFSDLSLWNVNVVLLESAAAIVRHVRPLDLGRQRREDRAESSLAQGAQGYQIGLEFLSEVRTSSEPNRETVHNVVRRAALLREGLRRTGIIIQLADEPSVARVFRSGKVDLATERMTLKGEDGATFNSGDVVSGRFDLGGTSYSFLAAIEALEDQGTASDKHWLSLRLPKSLSATRRRHSNRLRPSQEKPIRVEIAEPFGSWQVLRDVEELNAAGFSFPIDLSKDVFPIGTFLSHIQMQFPDGTAIPAKGRVRSLTPLPEASELGFKVPYKCGVELAGLTIPQQIKIADAIINTGAPEVEDAANQTTFPELWGFLEKSGFLYPEKMEKLRPDLPEITDTIEKLLVRRNRLFKTLLVRRSEGIQGHLSAVRLYRQTWCIQHLAALKQGQALFAARVLNLGLAEYFEQIPEMEWMKIFFRPNNKWPARVFGTFAHRLKAPTLSDIRTYVYWTGSAAGEPRPLDPQIQVRPANDNDLLEIEKYFITRGRSVALKADDLTVARAGLSSVNTLYNEFGLKRFRKVLIADRNGLMLGFALVEVSSLGLNLSELTNTFAVHVMQDEWASAARRALINGARQVYAQEGRSSCRGLSEEMEAHDYQAMGFGTTKSYSVWTWHRSLIRQYYEYVLRLFSRARDEPQT